ncbi:hypothetical protein [Catellatospora sichuanensis]|uniref:hypothetical protein n=1 Tax=Catellatospora sichuanensis TaxID=1969805 RepID=UPI001182A65C|nr:hypothetical protein [Catellatospora sichuanensis]
MSDNPYRAPAPAAPPVASTPAAPAVAAWSDPSLDAPPPYRRPVEARLVWRGIFQMLGAHALTMVLPLFAGLVFGQRTDHGPVADGDPAYVFLLAGFFAQFVLGVVALVAGVGGIIGRDGGKGAGNLIGWVAGIPVSLIVGIVITASLANA